MRGVREEEAVSRGTSLSRVIQYFKEAEIEEAGYALSRALSIVNERRGEVNKLAGAPKPVRKRKAKEAPRPLSESPIAKTLGTVEV